MAVVDNQVGDERMIDGLDRRERAHSLPQHAANLAAGGVARVEHAANAVRRLASERRTAVGVAVESSAPLQQLAHVPRAVLDQRIDRRLVAQSVAGADRVCRM